MKENTLIPINAVETQIKPEKIFAVLFFAPYIFFAFIVIVSSIYFNSISLSVVSLIILAFGYYKYAFILSHSYYITDQQLIIERGVFTKTVNYLDLYRVKDIKVSQPFLTKMVNLMNVTLLSFDTTEPILTMKGVKTSSIVQTIRNHVQECRQRNKI